MTKVSQRPLLSNKLLLFGGVYSNFHALDALKNYAVANHYLPHQIICTGDTVGYCAHPTASLELVKDWGIHCIAGNVEIQLANEADDCGCDYSEDSRCDIFSKQWYPFAQSKMQPHLLQWMKTLPENLLLSWGNQKIGVVHGSFFNTSEYIFKSTEWQQKAQNFDALNCNTIVAGHCGLPFLDQFSNKTWINPGVIGMPANDGDTRVWFATLEILENDISVNFHRLEYDHISAQKDMTAAKLPQAYAKTLLSGIWDNCDILPPEETLEQNKAIEINPKIYEKVQ